MPTLDSGRSRPAPPVESSVLFSLQELLSLEEERVQEEADRAHAEQSRERARLDALEREEAAREIAEQERREAARRARELERREEEVRLEAAREMGRASAVAESLREEQRREVERLHAAEERAASSKRDRDRAILKRWFTASAVALVTLVGFGVVAFRDLAERHANETADLRQQADGFRRKLASALGDLRVEVERTPPTSAPLAPHHAPSEPPLIMNPRLPLNRPRPPAPLDTKPSKTKECVPGDPMCSDL